jgi:hypothetical protein
MSDIRQARKALGMRILDGRGDASPTQRRPAFDNAGLPEPVIRLVKKVARHARRVTEEDIAAVRAAGCTEDQIFELVVCAAIGQATRQYEAALAAVEAATADSQASHPPAGCDVQRPLQDCSELMVKVAPPDDLDATNVTLLSLAVAGSGL